MVIEIVDLPIKNGDVLYSYVSLPEGDHNLWIIYVFCFYGFKYGLQYGLIINR